MVFAIRRAKEVTRITSAEVPAGRLSLQAQLTTAGKLLLAVNGKPVDPVSGPGLLSGQPAEPLNIGFDGQMTVDEYDGRKVMQGTIQKLSITTQP